MNVKKAIDCRQRGASRGFLARPSAAFMVGICWGNQTPRMPALKNPSDQGFYSWTRGDSNS